MGKRNSSPSLLDPESRGGDTAEGGTTFQDHITLAQLPRWFAYEGFTSFIREGMGDIEAKFFTPGKGWDLEFIEVKNHSLSPAPFWDEIARFWKMEQAGEDRYRKFTLVCTGLSDTLSPLVNSMHRLRGTIPFYDSLPAIADQSFRDYTEIVDSLGRPLEIAHFLFNKVDIECQGQMAQTHGEALFGEALMEAFPACRDLPQRLIHEVYTKLYAFLRNRRNKPVARFEIETRLLEVLRVDLFPPLSSIQLHTFGQEGEQGAEPALRFNWHPFFGGATRTYPAPQRWNDELVEELIQTRNWILEHRNNRRIRLTGSRRLSAAFAIGAVFPAVSGFVVEMEHRGSLWATDDHPTVETPPFPLSITASTHSGEQLVVTIGIGRDIIADVNDYVRRGALSDLPALHLHSSTALISPQHANVAAGKIKAAISEAAADKGAKKVHLFYAGPSHLALFLGHRLNAMVALQCYEWVDTGQYVPTCLI